MIKANKRGRTELSKTNKSERTELSSSRFMGHACRQTKPPRDEANCPAARPSSVDHRDARKDRRFSGISGLRPSNQVARWDALRYLVITEHPRFPDARSLQVRTLDDHKFFTSPFQHSLKRHGHLARSAWCLAPCRQGEPFDFSRQANTHKNHGHLDSVGLRPPRGSESGCAGRLLLPPSS
jgi:hypothetical protein